MTSDLRELYQSVILDHYKKPRNSGKLPDADHQAEGYNPLCGDHFTVYLKLEKDVVREVSFVGSGCAISTASASMMTERLKGKTREEAEALFRQFHDMLTTVREAGQRDNPATLGKLEAFAGVREFPIRIKCATLPWYTLLSALHGEANPVSTE